MRSKKDDVNVKDCHGEGNMPGLHIKLQKRRKYPPTGEISDKQIIYKSSILVVVKHSLLSQTHEKSWKSFQLNKTSF